MSMDFSLYIGFLLLMMASIFGLALGIKEIGKWLLHFSNCTYLLGVSFLVGLFDLSLFLRFGRSVFLKLIRKKIGYLIRSVTSTCDQAYSKEND